MSTAKGAGCGLWTPAGTKVTPASATSAAMTGGSGEGDRTSRVHAVASSAARLSYGRLAALLATSTKDVASAEDALADAFEQALLTWPRSGVPSNPDAWLFTVARNRIRDALASAQHRSRAPWDEVNGEADPAGHNDREGSADPDAIPDKRLELLFACAHPALNPAIHTPLMLQTVLGFTAAQIADAFAIPTATLSQRLVRAKRRIFDSGIPFRVPSRADMPSRASAVLEAIYGAYAISWLDQGEDFRTSIADEARWLAIVTAGLLNDFAEAWGLAALLTLAQSRAPARVGEQWQALRDQDPNTWNRGLISEGEALLHRAHSLGVPLGRFQLEAAIQSVHCDRARTGRTDVAALITLHRGLVAIAPSAGAHDALRAVLTMHSRE